MPSLYTHYLFGQDALALMDREVRAIVEAHPALYNLGLQGPDIFFYGSVFGPKSIAAFGHALHKKSLAVVLDEMTGHLGACPKQIWGGLPYPETAYLIGFIGHFVLDTICHSYIFRIQEDGKSHLGLETDWDQYLLAEKTKTPWKTSLASVVSNSREDRKIIEAVYAAYEDSISSKEVKNSAKAIYRIRKLMRFSNQNKYKFFAWAMDKLHMNQDLLAMFILPPQEGESVHLNWPGRPDDAIETLENLYQEALKLYPNLIRNVRDHLEQGLPYEDFLYRNFEGPGAKL
jgi:hypothetical protein